MNRFLDSLQQAMDALFDHKLRTALSVLGITIGIAAVMAVSTISKGGSYVIYSELETFGLNSVWVYRDRRTENNGRAQRQGSGIVSSDFVSLQKEREVLGIRNMSPVINLSGRQQASQARRSSQAQVLGVGRDYPSIVNDELLDGRFFNSLDIQERRPVALVAPTIVERVLDASQDPVGQTIRITGRRFLVIGVLASKSRDFLSSIGSAGGQNANDRILIPYTTLQLMKGSKEIGSLQLEVDVFEEAETVAQRVRQRLKQRHPDGFEYDSGTMSTYIVTANRILGGVAVIGIVAASISLLVGGMGIMNMMGTSVLERTREIGVRKAIGATERDILMQFLLEAGLISVTGGLLGLLLGGLASVALAVVTGFPVMPSLISIVGALLVSIVVGVLSGYLPARRAAKMKPVDALNTQ
ncbi:ABC transporter permease [Granulosicoccus antarcticus]|uniref:Macrolide export ATP-binding/permease protein MacB n=1 Tax=Granulosicoccus antarcticus IMCC3135 TaxID=1192854 RepID=A0A2Z2NXQ9_9GAMM|nr:ABC transporter permease [Granulosicoccus antarcticus]ASJ76232.1 Macrolide export ATP-binding/permease protein MacB [Granulosicoccus antarcticus IMCC3135]